MLALFYGTASNPAARNLEAYDWSCEVLNQSSVDSVVNTMYDDMLAKAQKDKLKRS